MPHTIDQYLDELRTALAGADRATIHDALADAEEHLRLAVEHRRGDDPLAAEEEIVAAAIARYGSPADVAAAYRSYDSAPEPPLGRIEGRKKMSLVSRLFGVLADPKAYGSLFYLVLSLATGIFYFTWAAAGLSLSAGLILLVFGIPFFGLFLLSIQGLALVEGRIIEALTGIRMPRRPIFGRKDLGLWGRFKHLATDPVTWKTIVYMVLQMPLGILYFTIIICMLAFALMGVASAVITYGFGLPLIHSGSFAFYAPLWLIPLIMALGFLWFVATLHVVKLLTGLHGRFAKAMLVSG